MSQRSIPLVVVASLSASLAQEAAASLRLDGNVVYVTTSAGGCLRVATNVAPDVILIDPRLPRSLERLLRAHPNSARAEILPLDRDVLARLARLPLPAVEPVLHAA